MKGPYDCVKKGEKMTKAISLLILIIFVGSMAFMVYSNKKVNEELRKESKAKERFFDAFAEHIEEIIENTKIECDECGEETSLDDAESNSWHCPKCGHKIGD